jgi:hypothetical protein
MKNSKTITLGLLILSGAGLAMADEAVLGNKTMVKPGALTSQTHVDAAANMGDDRVAVNGADSAEVDQSAIHEHEMRIGEIKKDIDRDSRKLKEDTDKLTDAQSKNAADETAKSQSDVDNDKKAIHRDSVHLKVRLADKIEDDKSIIRKFDEKIRDGQKAVDRDSQKTADDTARVADAQSRNASDDEVKAKADIEVDKDAVADEKAKLEKHTADKAERVAELKRDRRRLDDVVKHLNEDGQASADVDADAAAEASDDK